MEKPKWNLSALQFSSLNKNQKTAAAVLILLLAVLLCVLAATSAPQPAGPAVLTGTEAQLEYGKDISEITPRLIAGDSSQIRYNLDNVTMNEDLNVPMPGAYGVDVYDGDTLLGTITLYVNDTVRPSFDKAPETVQVDEGFSGDLLSNFEASDLSGVTLSLKADQVDLYTPGAYEASVTARDGAGNEQTVFFTVQVIEGNGMITIDAAAGTVERGILIVNKKHPLDETYDPGEDPQAASALRSLIEAMKAQGLDVSEEWSGYRTYNSQKQLYENYVLEHGQQEADRFSARPGYSEHQSGLAFDLRHNDGSLIEREPEAAWLAANAADYGFIIRYPQGKESVTGYQYEPWHLRYVGVSDARAIQAAGLSLEEYLGVEGGDYQNS